MENNVGICIHGVQGLDTPSVLCITTLPTTLPLCNTGALMYHNREPKMRPTFSCAPTRPCRLPNEACKCTQAACACACRLAAVAKQKKTAPSTQGSQPNKGGRIPFRAPGLPVDHATCRAYPDRQGEGGKQEPAGLFFAHPTGRQTARVNLNNEEQKEKPAGLTCPARPTGGTLPGEKKKKKKI
jgi:hypothetical protein